MGHEAGHSLWLVFIDVVLPTVLAVALIYGTMMWARSRRHPIDRRALERGTERVYRETERQNRRELLS